MLGRSRGRRVAALDASATEGCRLSALGAAVSLRTAWRFTKVCAVFLSTLAFAFLGSEHAEHVGGSDGRRLQTTASLGRRALHRRLLVYGGIMCGCTLLLVVAAVWVNVKKKGLLKIGRLLIAPQGVFWNQRLLCCGKRRVARGEEAASSSSGQQLVDDPGDGGDLPLLPLGLQTTTWSDEKLQSMKQQAAEMEERTRRENEAFLRKRNRMLYSLFVLYIGCSLGIPAYNASTVSCEAGYFWEPHMLFFAAFLITKLAELYLYLFDPTLVGELDALDFLLKFVPSFLAFADGYTDATAIAIANSCPHSIAQGLALAMLITYVLGVVIGQWGIVAFMASRDPSQACFLKVLHMDTAAVCVSLPENQQRTWNALHMMRTLGEDLPQAVLQTLFLIYVKENYFMVLSICVGVGTSCKALWDALHRALQASGVYERLQQQDDQQTDQQTDQTKLTREDGWSYETANIESYKVGSPEQALEKFALHPDAPAMTFFDRPDWANNCFIRRDTSGRKEIKDCKAISWRRG